MFNRSHFMKVNFISFYPNDSISVQKAEDEINKKLEKGWWYMESLISNYNHYVIVTVIIGKD